MDKHDPEALPAVNPHAEQALSMPVTESLAATPHEKQSAQQLEQQTSGLIDPSATTQPGGGLPPIAPLAVIQPDPSNPVPMPPSPAVPTMPQIADDADLIEKEWVLKAKQIVEHTKHDPYKQNEEMTKIKAEYLKKRYGREVK